MLDANEVGAGYVFGSVFVFVCTCLQDYCKSNQPISLKLGVMIGSINGTNRLTFDGDPVPDTESRSLFHFRQHCRIGHLGDLLSVLIQSPASVQEARRNN